MPLLKQHLLLLHWTRPSLLKKEMPSQYECAIQKDLLDQPVDPIEAPVLYLEIFAQQARQEVLIFPRHLVQELPSAPPRQCEKRSAPRFVLRLEQHTRHRVLVLIPKP